MPAALEEFPEWLKRAINKFPDELQAKLLALYDRLHFSVDSLDAFEVNNNAPVSLETFPAFEKLLERERMSAEPKVDKSRASARQGGLQTSTPHKRKSQSLPHGVFGAFQRTQTDVTPFAKRPRDSLADELPGSGTAVLPGADAALEEPARRTPDPLTKPVQLSVRASLNEQLAKPLKPMAANKTTRVELLGDASLWKGEGGASDRNAYNWMDESIEERASRLDERLAAMETDVANELMNRHKNDNTPPALGAVGQTSQAEVVLCGRIVCEGLEGKLNERSLLLEGSRASSGGASIRLHVNECPAVTVFPGQIVGVLGRSGMSGTTFHAREIAEGLSIPPRIATRGDSPLHVVVAAGPYCLRDGIAYAPLERVLEHAVHEKPEVLILLGPFLDASNMQVVAGTTTLPGDDEPCAFEDVYAHLVLKLLHRGLAELRRASPHTQVLMVPSLDEVLVFHPMPQPPLDVSLGLSEAMVPLRRLGVKFLPNPAHVSVGGLRMSITSADALSPLLRDLVLRGEGNNKIQESLQQLLRQRTLFPVLPRDPPQVSEVRASALDFPDRVVPDVCIFPSQIGGLTGAFVDDVAFVNPGYVCRPAALGTFAEFWVTPPSNGEPLSERVRVDVQKLS